jgi:dipeptidyl aminopeptidase/acylaminoacyl peptidase
MRFRPVVLALLVAVLPAATHGNGRPMSFDDVMAVRSVGDTEISPDGRWIAYVVTERDLKENQANADIWLVAAAGDRPPVRLTTSPKNDSQPRWSPDGQRLAFISSREEKPQIFLISPFGGEAIRLTDSKSGVQGFQWSPDGRRIAYLAEPDPTKEEEQKRKDKDDVRLVDRDFRYRRLWAIDVETKQVEEIVGGDFQVADPQWAPDGGRIAYVTTPTPKADDGSLTDVWVVELATKARRKLVENQGPDQAPRWSPDGTQLAILTRPASQGLLGQMRLAIVPAGGGAPREVAPGFLYQPGPAEWARDGRTIYFTASTRTSSQIFAVPAEGGEPAPVSKTDGVIGSFSFAPASGTAAFTLTDMQRPADVWVNRAPGAWSPVKLTDHNPQVRELALGRSEVVRWKSRDGLEVEGLVLYPVGYEAGRRYPLIVHVHGGPAGVYANAFPASWSNYGHVWAGRGWLVFYPNPRGSSGYGERFLLANVRDWGGGDYHDIQTGVDALVARGLADPARMGQTGWSYGGYMTAWTLTQTDRFKAVMVGAGLTNMYSMYSTNDLQRTLEGYFGAEPWNDFDVYWDRSAMKFIKQAKTPTLIMHGAADERVPIGQAQELYMGLKKNGVPVELAVYPREPHGLQEPRHQLDKMTREYAWFARHVLGESATAPTGQPDPPGR